ncbi:MAG: MCE family protein [Coxiellaceae bacterium]|nr:MCE family protein [Coxiellaceae bacterium]
MDTKVNYFIVGLFVVGLTFVTIVLSVWIAGGHHTTRFVPYVTFVDEPVDGLSEKATVRFNGVEVGYVDEIGLNPKDPQEVRLLLQLQEGTPVNQSTIATIRSQGITGITYIGLHAMKQQAPPIKVVAGEEYPVIPYSSSLFKKLDTIAQDVGSNVSKVAAALTELLGERNQQNVRRILENIQTVTSTLERNSETMENAIQSANKMLTNTAKASEQFEQTVADIRHTANDFSTLAKDARETVSSANHAIKDVADQTLPNIYLSLSRLKRVLGNVEILSEQLTNNPSMLVRGKNADPNGPGE